ncbi:Pao retrotransposon peptidase family protein [Dirofilaria immitis]|nr:Pao retrotransposon peptidase family protein [Dirofilaria immitis]
MSDLNFRLNLENTMEKFGITENEADESDSLSDDSNYHKPLRRRRSATVSPAAGTRFRHHSKSRRRSEMNLILHKQTPSLRRADGSHISARYEHKDSLRKTNSMPSFEQAQKAHVEAIRQLLDLFPISPCNQSSSAQEVNALIPKVWQPRRQNLVPKMVESESEDDIINTDIEELRDAAQSIQSLQRVLKVPPESMNINKVEMVDRRNNCPVEGDSSSESLRQSGIASRLGGHPRGVIQFLSSAKQTKFFPTLDTYNTFSKNKAVDKKACNSSNIIRPKAVKNPLIYTTTSSSLSNPLVQADLLLWSKRSRTSIRRHNDVRNMAIRELCDTEKTFVENLEYLTQKYMRPLRQPLECTLIDPILADKIFYKVPEILIHHQHFLAALYDRLDIFQSDARIGDILLSHEITGMSTSLIKSAQPTLEKLELLLTEINELDLSDLLPVDQQLTQEETRHLYEVRKRSIGEKLERIEQYVSILEIINNNWLDYIQKTTNAARKKEEEEIYIEMADQEKGILRLLSQGREVKTTLKLYNKDLEIAIRSLTSGHISQGNLNEVSAIGPQVTVHLPQLQLPTFSGDPKTWRQFWNSFDVAVHFQAIPDVQKLNYLMSCLRGEALLAVRGYDIAPQNYNIIRKVLIEKFGEDSIIKKSLYAELQSIKRSDRDWKVTIEAIERILRQLEAIGENLDHCSIETSIESKLPIWILHKVYEQKKRGAWSIDRLRQILGELVQINEEVARNQSFSNEKKSIDFKQKRASHNNKGETSALSTIKQFKSTKSSGHESTTQPKKIARDKRPCAFCNKDHWDNECSTYPTLKQRMEYLRKNNACLNCLRTGHATNNCNKKKRSCFHCKNPHNTALCYVKYGMQTAESRNSANVINSIAQSTHQQGQEILLLCKEIEIINPIMPENHEEVLVLFDIGSQSSFISTKLANRLRLERKETENLSISSFGNKFPRLHQTTKVDIGVKTVDSEIITINTYVLDYLTDKLKVIKSNYQDLPRMISLEQLDHGGDWKRPDILIGADYFFDFMSSYEFYKTSSGFYVILTKVGPIVTGIGYIKNYCSSKTSDRIDKISVEDKTMKVGNVTTTSDIEQFWKLELIGIQEQPNACDDEKALEQFKKESQKEITDIKLKTLVKRLRTDKLLFNRYNEVILQQVQSNIIEEVTPNMSQGGVIHYLPHHEVLTPGKSTTKLRIVYDASARLKGMKSLNDVLYRGPITLPDLAGVLLRFRTMKNVIIADIEKAFLQLELFPSERNCTRFLWLKNIQGEVTDDNIVCYPAQYDPLGFLVPTMVQFKLFLQHLWKRNYTWDQSISEEDEETWECLIKEWSTDIKDLPRCVIHPSEQMQLHVFTDASSLAYSAAIYVRNYGIEGVKTSLIFAKSRIAPIKGITIPRLELLAIIVGVRAVHFVINQLNLEKVPVTL